MPNPAPASQEGEGSSQPRVLLVDDNPEILRLVAALLTPACLVVGTLTNGVEGLRVVRTLNPDVVVLDVSMPDITGFEVARRLRDDGCAVAIVFLSMHDDEDLIQAASALDAAYVLKTHMMTLLPAVLAAYRAVRSGT